MSPWFQLVPMLVVALGGFALMLVDALGREESSELATLSAVICFAAAAVAAVIATGTKVPGPLPAGLGSYLTFDNLTQFVSVVICIGAGMSALLAGGYLREHALERGEFYALLLFSAFGAMVLAASTDLLSLFIGLETMSLGVYSMVAFRRGSPRAAEGGIKYFLLGSFAAAILLFGSALLYGATGHTDFVGIGEIVRAGEAEPRLLILGMLMLLVGLLFKVSVVPFHMWTPDAYEGAVTPATTFMSVVVKAAAFAVMLRVVLVCFGDELSSSLSTGWPGILAGLAAVTMVYGNVAAAMQTSVKRMLAYSSIAHAGYILVGVVTLSSPDPTVRQTAVSGVLFYLLAYTVSNVLAFGSLIAMGSYGKEAVSYEDLAGVGRRHPLVALPFIVGALSLMGFPPTAGFLGKWYVFSAAVSAGDQLLWLVILGVLTSVIGAYYYVRVIVFMFMKAPEPGAPIAVPMRSGYVTLALVLSGYFVLKMGVTPANYIDMALAAAGKVGG
ncbi:MAG TPA: NADH-quinone oxidoreductase subunit N [Polyangiales bacterium]|nr:NADH-quinone oxidoreductase subunit N [Polyangiales bacterium]